MVAPTTFLIAQTHSFYCFWLLPSGFCLLASALLLCAFVPLCLCGLFLLPSGFCLLASALLLCAFVPLWFIPSSFLLLPYSFLLPPSSFLLPPSSFFLLPSSFFLIPSSFRIADRAVARYTMPSKGIKGSRIEQ